MDTLTTIIAETTDANVHTVTANYTKSARYGVIQPWQWYGNITVASVSIFFAFYATVGWITRELLIKRRSHSENVSERRLTMTTRGLCILAALSTLSGAILKLVTHLTQRTTSFEEVLKPTEGFCDVVPVMRDGLYLVSTTSVYLFLWARQRVFYINSVFQALNGKILTIISYIVLLVWLGCFVFSLFFLITIAKWVLVQGVGCVAESESIKPTQTFFIGWIVACTFMQIFLLTLFVYPIIKQVTSTGAQLLNSRMYRRVKKAAILTVVCIVTDIMAYVVRIVITRNKLSVYVLNFTVNVYSIILCYDFWKEVFLPCKIKKERRSHGTSKRSNASARSSTTEV